jgi:hypothetical protein
VAKEEEGSVRQRYCGNCGNELGEGQKFCGNCGSPVHATARVPTPEADVPIPPPPQQQQSAVEDGRETRWPMLALLGVFLLVAVVGTAQGMAEVNPNRDLAIRLASGMGYAAGSMVFVGLVVLIWCVGGYLLLRSRRGLTFGQMVFSWPVVIVAGVVACFNLFA